MERRRGVTLVETIIVISTMSVIMVLGITMIYFMMRVEGNTAKTLVDSNAFARLASSLRRDIRAAYDFQFEANSPDPPTSLTLMLTEGTQVAYRINAESVVRLAKSDGISTTVQHFRLPSVEAEFRIHDDQSAGNTALVELVLTRQHAGARNRQSTGSTRDYKIQASLGSDHRFEENKE